jgi:hypothetical protein
MLQFKKMDLGCGKRNPESQPRTPPVENGVA